MDLPQELRTDRLYLRRWRASDRPTFARLNCDPRVVEFLPGRLSRPESDALADRIEAIGVEAFVREWSAQPLFAGLPRGVAEQANADRRRNTAAGLAAALRGLGTGVMPSLWDRLGELRVPVTVVVGDRDAKFLDIGERMAAALSDARLVVVPGAGHALPLEAPDAVAAALEEA
jgi:pimeloyl-ACP methyl ester carboxylesterase